MFALAIGATAEARNTVTKVGQVAEAVTLTEDVDYVITGTDPFTTTGSIDITNTEHAVVIFENIRPSKALEYLGFIKINGENAVNDENCQVKMYASGAIIMPYGKDFKPLTVYSEQNFGGESANDFGLENAGGYMNTLTAETHLLKDGRRTCFYEIAIYDDTDTLVAVVSTTGAHLSAFRTENNGGH